MQSFKRIKKILAAPIEISVAANGIFFSVRVNKRSSSFYFSRRLIFKLKNDSFILGACSHPKRWVAKPNVHAFFRSSWVESSFRQNPKFVENDL